MGRRRGAPHSRFYNRPMISSPDAAYWLGSSGTDISARTSSRSRSTKDQKSHDGDRASMLSITNNKHGKVAVRAFCTPTSPSAAGEVRFCDITVSKKGKVTVRSTGYDSMKVVVKAKATPKKGQEGPLVAEHLRKAWKVSG
jgi:hypothetical protein